jgi:hypothetical protein
LILLLIAARIKSVAKILFAFWTSIWRLCFLQQGDPSGARKGDGNKKGDAFHFCGQNREKQLETEE